MPHVNSPSKINRIIIPVNIETFNSLQNRSSIALKQPVEVIFQTVAGRDLVVQGSFDPSSHRLRWTYE